MWLIVLLNWHFCDFLLYLSQSKYEDQGNFPVFAAGQHSFGLFVLMAPLSRCWCTPGEILSQISRLTRAVNICAGALVSGGPNMAAGQKPQPLDYTELYHKSDEGGCTAGRLYTSKVAAQAVAADMIFVKSFTLADFGLIIFYPKARNSRHITFCDKSVEKSKRSSPCLNNLSLYTPWVIPLHLLG